MWLSNLLSFLLGTFAVSVSLRGDISAGFLVHYFVLVFSGTAGWVAGTILIMISAKWIDSLFLVKSMALCASFFVNFTLREIILRR